MFRDVTRTPMEEFESATSYFTPRTTDESMSAKDA